MAFDPDKFLGAGGFDPDKFIEGVEVPPPAPPEAPQRSWGDIAKDAAGRLVRYSPPGMMYRAATDPVGTLQSTDDAVRAAANAVTFGMADRFAGYMGGEGTDAEVAKSAAARERSPAASLAGDVAGSVALPGFGAARLAARMGGGVAARAGAYGLTGGATGAAQGAGNTYTGNPWDYAQNALIGGAMGSVLGAGSGAAFGARPMVTSARTPTTAEQRAFKNDAYADVRANPARYNAAPFAQRAENLEQNFHAGPGERFVREYSPDSFRTLDDMRAPQAAAQRAGPGATADLNAADIDLIRRRTMGIPNTEQHATDRTSARIVRRAIDDFIENPPRGAVMPGSEAAAARASRQSRLAREANAGYKRSQLADILRHKAYLQAGSTHSGLNYENALRQQYRNFVTPSVATKRSRAQNEGFGADDIAQMEGFASGDNSRLRNALRWAGNAAGGGQGLGLLTAAGVGGGAGLYYNNDPTLGLAIAGGGLGAKMLGNRIADRASREITQRIQQNNPLYRQRLLTAPMVPGGGDAFNAKAARDALTLQLLKQTEDKRRTRNAP